MYRIMIVKSKRDNYTSLYQYLTTTVTDEETGEEQTVIDEFADEAALDKQVEKMLNEDGFAKADFIIVKHIDYQIDANGYAEGAEESDD